MFSHYFIVISINLMTVSFELIHAGGVHHWVPALLIIVSLIVFYLSIMANKEYYYEEIELTGTDMLLMIIVTIVGSVVICLFIEKLYAFLIGSFIITFGNFLVLLKKFKKFQKDISLTTV